MAYGWHGSWLIAMGLVVAGYRVRSNFPKNFWRGMGMPARESFPLRAITFP